MTGDYSEASIGCEAAYKTVSARTFIILLIVCFFLTSCTKTSAEDSDIVFSFSGGTGKVGIECLALDNDGDVPLATVVFDSQHYQYVKAEGVQYDRLEPEGIADAGLTADSLNRKYNGEYSAFSFPVPENGTLEILAMTTAMSTSHEITYTLYFGDAVSEKKEENEEIARQAVEKVSFTDPGKIEGLRYTGDMENYYAHGFTVHEYEDGYRLIDINDSAQYLLVPVDAGVPENLPEDIVVLKAPLDRIYLAASNIMSLFFAMEGEDNISLTGLDADGWQIDGPAKKIREGSMRFAGKYSAPDYELLIREGCDLAVENTMILHSPEVIEKIEALGIPVMIDRSSYETHPLGRTEWIRLYGVLCGCEEKADAFFDEQKKQVMEIEEQHSARQSDGERKTVAFFALTTQGTVTVRRADDYIAQMIEMAGASYAFSSIKKEGTQGGTETVSMEEFYSMASDADYLIYNAAIVRPIESREKLVEENALFEDFRAVREDRVYQVGKNLYQSSDIAGKLIRDIYLMLDDAEDAQMTFLEKLP